MQKIDLNPFKEYLTSRIKKGVTNGQKLFLEIQDLGFNGSYETLYRYLRNNLNDYWIKPYQKSHFHHRRSSINLSKYKRALRIELASCRYIENATNIAFLGSTGVGKTHLASALGREAIYAGSDVRFLSLRTVNELIDKLADSSLNLRRLMNSLCRPKVLILDEIALFDPNDTVAKFLVELLLNRHLKSSTIFTSNKTFKNWGNAFGDIHTSAMVLDRITQRTEVVDIEGPSYRLKDRINSKVKNL